jgi:uncharacterized protein (TIGR03083 family)
VAEARLSKEQLIEGLRTSEQQLIESLDSVAAADLESGCYENGWNAREVLAHVASMEWTYAKILDIAAKKPKAEGSPAKSAPPASGAIGSYADRQIEKRAQASVADLLAEFRENRAKTLAAVESAEESILAAPVQSAGGLRGSAANVLQGLAVGHVMMHLNDIMTAVRKAS